MKASGHTELAMPALFKTVRFSAKDVWIFRLNFTAIEWSLEEIEFHVRQSQYVRSAVVIPYQPNGTVEYLIAAIVPEEHEFEKEFQLTSAIKKEPCRFPSGIYDPEKIYLSGSHSNDG